MKNAVRTPTNAVTTNARVGKGDVKPKFWKNKHIVTTIIMQQNKPIVYLASINEHYSSSLDFDIDVDVLIESMLRAT